MDTTTKEKLMSEAQSTEPTDADQQDRIASYIATAQEPRIDRTVILEEVVVSTMWVSFANPRMETMIIGGPLDGRTVDCRYATEADARAGHAAVVEALRDGRTPDGLVA